jgi:hypothetical protein
MDKLGVNYGYYDELFENEKKELGKMEESEDSRKEEE